MGTSLFALSAIMQKSFQNYFDLIPTGEYNLTRVHVPIYHPDGDAISIYLRTFDRDQNIRIYDCGMTLQRLSYKYNVGDAKDWQELQDYLIGVGAKERMGAIYLNSHENYLFENIMKFVEIIKGIYELKGLDKKKAFRYIISRQIVGFSPHYLVLL